MVNEFSEEHSAQKLDSWVDLGPWFIDLQGTTRKPFFSCSLF